MYCHEKRVGKCNAFDDKSDVTLDEPGIDNPVAGYPVLMLGRIPDIQTLYSIYGQIS